MFIFNYQFFFFFFFFNDTATTEIYTLSLHDALPIFFHPKNSMPTELDGWQSILLVHGDDRPVGNPVAGMFFTGRNRESKDRSEEHTSELQSHSDLVCRLLLEKKKK